MKYFLLARPSALIVQHMKALVQSAGYEPLPLTNLREVEKTEKSEIAAVVVSTALSSPVKESFAQVIDYCWRFLGPRPIFLASYADLRRTKIIAGSKFRDFGMQVDILGLEETRDLAEFDYRRQVFVITQKEIANSQQMPIALVAVKKIVQGMYDVPSIQ